MHCKLTAIAHAMEALTYRVQRKRDVLYVRYKKDGSPVTNVDLEVERNVQEILRRWDPIPPLLSEESCACISNNSPSTFWVLDPIDGTKGLLADNGMYVISLARIYRGRPIWGLLAHPPSGRLLYGGECTKGIVECHRGTRRVFSPFRTLPTLFTNVNGKYTRLRRQFQHLRHERSAYAFMHMIEYEKALYLREHALKSWDIAAADALLRTLGGGIFELETQKPIHYTWHEPERSHNVFGRTALISPQHIT